MYTVPTSSDKRYQELMRLLDKVQEITRERHLNTPEYQTLNNLRLKINTMRFGTPPVLEYPHWAEVYNRINEILDVPRRVPIAGGAPSERHEHHEEDAVSHVLEEEFQWLQNGSSSHQDEQRQ